MPKKASEQLRNQVVTLRKTGATYTQIEKQTINPETGQPISRPTLIKILREAGLTQSAGPAAKPPAPMSSSQATTTAPQPGALPAPATSNGVDDFMPAKTTPKAKPTGPIEVECDNCGTEITADIEADLPETCPGCGQ